MKILSLLYSSCYFQTSTFRRRCFWRSWRPSKIHNTRPCESRCYAIHLWHLELVTSSSLVTHWQRWIIVRVVLIWHLILSYQSPDPNSLRRHESATLTGASRNTWETPAETRRSFHKGLIERKKKRYRKIRSCVGKTSRLTWRCDRYVIHTRLTTPARSTTTAASDSVTSWTKEKGNVREFNHHRHHHHHRAPPLF